MNLLTDRLAFIYKERPTLRGDRGQIDLVVASGATKSVVNQWLSGKIKKIDIHYALSIERALGFSHIWLMTGEGDPLVDQTPAASARDALSNLDQDTRDVLEMMRMADAGGRAAARDAVVEALTKRQELTERAAILAGRKPEPLKIAAQGKKQSSTGGL